MPHLIYRGGRASAVYRNVTCKYIRKSKAINFVPHYLALDFSNGLLLINVSLHILLILEIRIITSVNKIADSNPSAITLVHSNINFVWTQLQTHLCS